MEPSNPKVHNVKQNLVLHKDSKSHEKFMWDIYVAVARQYSNNLSEETKKGLNEKASQGHYPGSQKRGYKTIGDAGHKIWVIDNDSIDSTYIPQAFGLYNSGNYTLRTLSKKLLSEGWKTEHGKAIATSELHRILIDPFYCGEYYWHGKLHTQAKHSPMISKELFYSVQERMTRIIKAGKYRKHVFLFGGGFMICGECGRSVTGEVQKGILYYHCTKHNNNCSQKKYTRGDVIEKQILQILDDFKIENPRLLEWIRKALKEAHKSETEYHVTTLKELDAKYLQTQKRLSVLYDDRVDGLITKEQYEAKREQYESEASSILEAKEKHDKADVDYRQLGINIFELSQMGRDLYQNKALLNEKRELLNFVFSNLKLKDGKIVPTPQNGFEVVALRAEKGDWLRIRDLNPNK